MKAKYKPGQKSVYIKSGEFRGKYIYPVADITEEATSLPQQIFNISQDKWMAKYPVFIPPYTNLERYKKMSKPYPPHTPVKQFLAEHYTKPQLKAAINVALKEYYRLHYVRPSNHNFEWRQKHFEFWIPDRKHFWSRNDVIVLIMKNLGYTIRGGHGQIGYFKKEYYYSKKKGWGRTLNLEPQ